MEAEAEPELPNDSRRHRGEMRSVWREVGLSGLEPLTSALSGRFRPPEHAKRRQRVAVNSRPDKAQRGNSGTRCQSTSGTDLRRRESRTRPELIMMHVDGATHHLPWPHVRLGRSEDPPLGWVAHS